ncbi:hypothetical protein EAH74_17845 [Pseudomonas mandelii]|uniref:Uncharacterized protein n=1 Tax=Pseudomonas mandelii TaxID=75612 RepID=A0A502I6W5_9PSED|nr:hypothetical protein EAH74_17845 [Pseudomonas mandelii]
MRRGWGWHWLRLIVTELAPSRAGSLPHWFCVVHKSSVGASLLAKAIYQATQDLQIHRRTCFNVSAIKNANSSD